MTWFRCQNGNGGGGGTQRYYILDPDVSDDIFSLRTAQVSAATRAYVPFYAKINNDVTSGFPEMGYWGVYGGQGNAAIIRRNGYQVGSVFIGTKIPHGVYSKLYVNCEVLNDSMTTFRHAEIVLVSDGSVDNYSRPNSSLKTVTLVDQDKTAAEINAQTGVVITSTDPLLLSAQTVEIDISSISQDFYFAFWNCDRTVQIRSIYLE